MVQSTHNPSPSTKSIHAYCASRSRRFEEALHALLPKNTQLFPNNRIVQKPTTSATTLVKPYSNANKAVRTK